MGIHEIQDELQDLSFQVLRPDACATITKKLDALLEGHSQFLEMIAQDFTQKLKDYGISAKVTGRRKRPYSIWRKMEHHLISFEQLSDIVGFRVVVDTIDNCYRALGVAHAVWPLVPGRFKDYISLPKQNDYRSLHTTVVGPKNQRIEFQIRTEDMNRIAEYGIAAHVLYKEGHTSGNVVMLARESQAYQWLRSTITLLAEGENPEEFLEHTKLELFTDQVFCFTPKGRLIALPQGANPIDFAYAVHTTVGNTAVGCKINGHIASLVSPLQNGDEVEILRSDSQTPPAAWEGLVRTGKARSSIRRATRAASAQQYGALGSHVLERAFIRSGHPFSLETITASLTRLAYGSLEELLTAVGRGEVDSADVLRAVYPENPTGDKLGKKKKQSWLISPQNLGRRLLRFSHPTKRKNNPNALPIRGINYNLPVRFSPQCGAVPGDRIVGILTPGSEITIYPIQSPTLAQFENEPDRWLDLRWDMENLDHTRRFPAQITLNTINEPGTLAAVALAISEKEGNIENVSMTRRTNDVSDMIIDISVYNVHHLKEVIHQLRTLPMTSNVKRLIR
jgi:GTP pyrophosphokinase